MCWELFTEPEAGSDLPALKTRAVREGDEYLISGNKVFVGGMHKADYHMVLAITNPDQPRFKNLSAFLVPADAPGITIEKLQLIGGGGKNMAFLDNVRVPASCRIGKEGDGWRAFAGPRLSGGAAMLHDSDRWLERLIDYCKRTRRNGQPLSKDPQIQELLTQTYIEHHALRALRLRSFWMGATKQRGSYEGRQGSMLGKLWNLKLAAALLKALGPAALTNDTELAPLGADLEYQMRMAIVGTHPAGTVEVQKLGMFRGMAGIEVG
ncbi:MAG: acyl-CoA dehydrogenase [Chloroflexi bacterium]|nr:acyl-CoA dehydrogenase [Chloroflexota bacterium]